MYQQDYVMNEARKLARLLAKLMGLKVAGEYEEYTRQFDAVLQDEYHIELDLLLDLKEDAFEAHVLSADYSPEKKLMPLARCCMYLPNHLLIRMILSAS